jgi:hypothetical protein
MLEKTLLVVSCVLGGVEGAVVFLSGDAIERDGMVDV